MRTQTDDGEVLKRIRACLPPGWRPSQSPGVSLLYSLVVGDHTGSSRVRRYHLVYRGGLQLARTTEVEEAYDVLEQDMLHAVAGTARRRVFVRAGVAVWRGCALLVLGRGGGGKSTLVEALVRAGATYFSDEYAAVDTKGRVHPYRTRLTLRDPTGGQRRVSEIDAPSASGASPQPVALIVDTAYRPDGLWRPRRVTEGEAALRLFAEAVDATVRPEFVLPVLRSAACGALTLRGSRGEAQETALSLLKHLAKAKRAAQRLGRVAGV